MEEIKKNQAENENMPTPKSLKKMNKTMKVMLVIAVVCFIIYLIFGSHTAIGTIAAFIEIGLIVIVCVMRANNRIQK